MTDRGTTLATGDALAPPAGIRQVGERLRGAPVGQVAAALASHPSFRRAPRPSGVHRVGRGEISAVEARSSHRQPRAHGRTQDLIGTWPDSARCPNRASTFRRPRGTTCLDHVLIHQDVEAFWQPIVDLRGPSVVGYEGFARFAGATGLSPDRWFSEAATRGRRSELEALALRAALRRRGDAPRDCFLSLNVSPHALLDDHVQRALFDVPDLSGVVIELTTPTQPEDMDELARRAGPLRRAGAALAVDLHGR